MKRYVWSALLFFAVAVGVVTTFQMVVQAPDIELSETKAEAKTMISDETSRAKVNVVVGDFFFNPDEIQLKANQPNTITLRNNGNTQHTFTVEALKLDILLKPGETKQVDITPDKTGTFELYCRFHPRQMVGTVIVE